MTFADNKRVKATGSARDSSLMSIRKCKVRVQGISQLRCVRKQNSLHAAASHLPTWPRELRVATKVMFCKCFKWANLKKARRNTGLTVGSQCTNGSGRHGDVTVCPPRAIHSPWRLPGGQVSLVRTSCSRPMPLRTDTGAEEAETSCNPQQNGLAMTLPNSGRKMTF